MTFALLAAVLTMVSVSAHAATVEITIDNLVFSPAEATAKVGDTIVCRQHGRRPLEDQPICGKYCTCNKHRTTSEFFPAPESNEESVANK